ncbi:hypothetical protein [Holdemania filiformis]|uniref:hypothetical protein n=1 Tax=Holdemania filiformis TaxID=61171 RepID=UPI0024315D5E|nr:hypothetical protein [Holdemania filiformis]
MKNGLRFSFQSKSDMTFNFTSRETNKSERSEEDWHCFIPGKSLCLEKFSCEGGSDSANFGFAMKKVTLEEVDFQNALSITHQSDER